MPDRRTFLLAAALAVAGTVTACAPAGSVALQPADTGPVLVPGLAGPPLRPLAPPEVAVDKVPTTCVSPARVAESVSTYDPPALTTPTRPVPGHTIHALYDNPDTGDGDDDGGGGGGGNGGDPAGGVPGNGVALTIDDGLDTAVVAAYIAFVKATGIRLTFFVNGVNPSWTDNAPALRPLVDSGQVQLGNHTWSHPDITKLRRSAVATEINRNHDFIANTYGVDARPFFRPPFGFHTDASDDVAADQGYDAISLWYGTFGDAALLTETRVLGLAQQWLQPGAVVIGHANHPTVTHLYPQLVDILRTRSLHTVTLRDIYC